MVCLCHKTAVIGSSEEFGAWDAAAAPLMAWGEGDVWSLVKPLGPGEHEFKVRQPPLSFPHWGFQQPTFAVSAVTAKPAIGSSNAATSCAPLLLLAVVGVEETLSAADLWVAG